MTSNIPADKLLARFEINENHDVWWRRHFRRAKQEAANSTRPFEWSLPDPGVAQAVRQIMAKLCKPIKEVIP